MLEFRPELLLLQFIPVVLLVLGLHVILWRPMLRMLSERDRSIAGAARRAEQMKSSTADKLAELEARLDAARREVAAERAAVRKEAHDEEAAILAKARGEVNEMLEGARSELATARGNARELLKAEAAVLSEQIAASILGRSA